MEMGENWHINAPWAQLVATTKVPEDLFKTTLEMTDRIYADENRDSAGKSLAGQIRQEYFITQEMLLESGLMQYFIDMTIKYWGTVLTNGSLWQYLDKKFENGPHGFNYACRVVSAWTVHQFENEYNPIHNHANCKISAVMHLKFPEKAEPARKGHTTSETDDKSGLDGNLVFTGMGAADEWCTAPVLNCNAATVGMLHIFPSSLGHAVYPFRGKGERRSLSFNADVISKKQVEAIAEQEKIERNFAKDYGHKNAKMGV